PDQPERGALVADSDLAADERPEQLAVAAQPGEAGQERRSRTGDGFNGHAGRILGVLMRIVVDVSPLSRPRTGIGNYLRGMLAGLAEAGGDEHELVAFGPSGPRGRARIQAALAGLPLELRLPLLPRAQWWRAGWSRLGRPPVESVAGPLDVFHFSDWMSPAQRGGVRATTVHDLVPLRFPELVQRGTRRMHSRKLDAVRSCDVVFTNSRFTAGEVVELLGVAADRVVVAYPAVDSVFGSEGERADLGGPSVLSAAT